MLGWNYFSFVLNQAGSSLIGAQEMVKKIYFPRLIIPLSKAFVGFADYVVGLVLLIIVMLVYGVYPGVQILFLPLAFLVNVVSALGLGIWLSSLTIRYRDFQHIVPFMVQLGLYASPIAYPASLIPQKFQLLYHLNPVAGIVELYRYCFLATPIHDFTWVSVLMGVILFITGLLYFKKVEDIVADII